MAESPGSTSSGTGSGDSSSKEVPLFSCRHCPGMVFTAEETEAHRELHRKRRRSSASELSPGYKASFLRLSGHLQPKASLGKESEDNEDNRPASPARKTRGKAKITSDKRFDHKVKKMRLKSG